MRDGNERRQTERLSARHWTGRYRIEGRRAEWLPCRVIDLSLTGVGIDVPEPVATFVDVTIVVELTSASRNAEPIEIRGIVRHGRAQRIGCRLGIEFIAPDARAREQIYVSLVGLQQTA